MTSPLCNKPGFTLLLPQNAADKVCLRYRDQREVSAAFDTLINSQISVDNKINFWHTRCSRHIVKVRQK